MSAQSHSTIYGFDDFRRASDKLVFWLMEMWVHLGNKSFGVPIQRDRPLLSKIVELFRIIEAESFETQQIIDQWEYRIIECDPSGSSSLAELDGVTASTAHSCAALFFENLASDLTGKPFSLDHAPPKISEWNGDLFESFNDWLNSYERPEGIAFSRRLKREFVYVAKFFSHDEVSATKLQPANEPLVSLSAVTPSKSEKKEYRKTIVLELFKSGTFESDWARLRRTANDDARIRELALPPLTNDAVRKMVERSTHGKPKKPR